jgi:hydrogenase maturation protease
VASDALSAPLVIGVGNLLRGDDAAGIAVARRLRGAARVLEHSGEATALVEALRGAPAVFIVDAASGTEPGKVHRFDAAVRPLPQGLFGASTHGFGVAQGIELARALGALPPVCVVYAVEGTQFRIGTPMSSAVEVVLADVAARIEAEIDAMERERPKRLARTC